MRDWKVEDSPLRLTVESGDWRQATTLRLLLCSPRRTGALVAVEVLGAGDKVLGSSRFCVDWVGDNPFQRWLEFLRTTSDAAPADWAAVSAVRLSCIEPGFWPTVLRVGPPEAIDEAPTWPVNESDTVIEMGWRGEARVAPDDWRMTTGNAAHCWHVLPERSRVPDNAWFIRSERLGTMPGFQQGQSPGCLTIKRCFDLDVADQSWILAKGSWDHDLRLTMTAIVDGGREVHLAQAAAPPVAHHGYLTIGAELDGASKLEALRITLAEQEERRQDGREIALVLFWVLVRRPTYLDDERVRTVEVRLTSPILPQDGPEETLTREVRQVPFPDYPESTTPIGDPLREGLPFGFFVRRDDLPQLRQRALEGVGRPIFERLRARADHAIASELVDQNYYGTAHGGGIGHPKGQRGAGMRIFAPEVAVAHLITGEAKYATAARGWVLRAARSDDWRGDHGGCVDRPQIGDTLAYWDSITEWHPLGGAGFMDHPFHIADVAFGVVVAYDMLYHCFSPAEREEVEQAFADHGVYMLYWRLARLRDFYVSMNQGVLFGTPLLMMAAFLRDRDEVYAEMYRFTLEFLEEFGERPWNHEGVCGEGPGYGLGTLWEYLEALPPIAACRGQQVADVIPSALAPVMVYAQHVRSTWWQDRPRFLALSDGGDGWLYGETLAFFANYLKDPVAQFFWDETCADNPPASLSALLFLGDRVEPAEPDLPPAKVFRDQPMAFLRTGWRHGDTLLCLNNIRHVTCHGHLDRGSVLLEYNGEQLLVDPGMIAYTDPGSGAYHNTNCHNLITFDQRNQLGEQIPYDTAIAHFLSLSGDHCPGAPGAIDWVAADTAAVYPEALEMRRHIVFLRPGFFVLIDQGRASAAEIIDLNFTCLGPLTEIGDAFVSTAAKNRLLIHTQATSPLGAAFQNWGTHWPHIPTYRMRRSTLAPTASCTFLTVLAPSPLDAELATVTPLEVAGGLGVAARRDGQEVTVALALGEDAIDVAGIQTDARIAALNRIDGELAAAVMLAGTRLATAGEGEVLGGDGPGLAGMLRVGGVRRDERE